MSKRNKTTFKDIWVNQTNIGKLFGISAIKVGNKLIEYGLKDQITKKATAKAIQEGFAKETPLKDGTYFCMWNKQKIKFIFSDNIKPLSDEEIWINKAMGYKKDIEKLWNEGQDKLASLMVDTFYDDIPKKHRSKIREIIENNGGF